METAMSDASQAAPAENLGVMARAIRIFASPSEAWGGLKQRSQWWFPMLVVVLFGVLSTAVLHQRSIVPMVRAQWDQQVESGQMTPQQAEQAEAFITGPAGLGFTLIQQAVLAPLMMLVVALMVWFGVGFVLGSSLKFRHALEVAAWSSLILIPAQFLTSIIGWFKETLRGVHVGFGILLPDADVPSKLQVGLGVFLDALGPLSIWYLAVGIIGASVLSGAARKSTAWVLGGLYLVLVLGMAALAALFTPGA